MPDILRDLFETSRFLPRWQCGNWDPFEGWLLILSDLAIFGAYAAIPFSIALYVLTKRREIVFPKLYWLFAAFILSCGITHLLEAVIFWTPVYHLAAAMKATTAVVSWATVFALLGVLPTALSLPGTARLNLALTKEIEERRRSEKDLQDLSTRLSLALAHSHLGDWVWESADDIVTLSPRAADIFGIRPRADLRWSELRQLLHPDDREPTRQAVEDAAARRKDYAAVYRVPREDGSIVWISARGRAQYDEHGKPWRMVGTVEDITSRKLLELDRERLLEAERTARAQAETANRVKDEFLATLSHELRTPLSAIIGWTHILQNRTEDGASVQSGLEIIARNARAQAQLVDDLLDMNGILSGKLKLNRALVDMHDAAAASLESVRPAATARGIHIALIAPENPLPVEADAPRIQQVLWNLLANAVKFSPAGGSVRLIISDENPWVSVSVTDEGVGISRDFLPRVFDRFVQEDSSISRSFRGLGLGLAIAKNLVHLHGGTIAAFSEGAGRGATFTVRLPLAIPIESKTPSLATTGSLRPQALHGVRILAVDDEPDALSLLATLLSQDGASVTTAATASDALKIAVESRFDVVISDLGMPLIDGFEFLRRLRAIKGDIPAVALTAFVREEDRAKAIDRGFDAFVAKPVDPSELIGLILRLADRKR